MAGAEHSITRLFQQAQSGDRDAESRLFQHVYAELRRMAAARMRRERPDHTLQPTALVNEAWIQLLRRGRVIASDRTHFFRLAARIMNHFLTDYAKARDAAKRPGGRRVELTDSIAAEEEQSVELLALERALESLRAAAPRQHQIVMLHFLAGFTFEAVGESLGISAKTAKRDWQCARLWLHGQLYGWADDAGALAAGK